MRRMLDPGRLHWIKRAVAAMVLFAGASGLALQLVIVAGAQTPGATVTIEVPAPYRYAVTLPAGCRREEGPGTVDAICSSEFDAEKSAEASTASSLIFQAGAELVPEDADKPASALAAGYGETTFKNELPEAVCGEADRARTKIDKVKQVLEGERVIYTAEVLCKEIKFLGVGERRAEVKYLITPGLRYRVMARAPAEEFEQNKDAIDAFFSTFRTLPAG